RVNTAASRPNMNNAFPTTYSYFKAHSPVRRPFNKKSAAKTNNFNEKVNTAKVNNVTTAGPKAAVSDVEENMNNVVKSLAFWIWRPKGNLIDHISKDSGSYTLKRFNYVDPQGRLKDFYSRCSRHMTGNKFYLTDYQEIDGGFVAFRGNAKEGKITRKEGRERAQRNKFESMFGQDKDVNGNKIFTPLSATGSTYVNLDGSILVNAATLSNADLLIDPLMPDLEDTTNL
nr:hypothetical protein [Tanacetum cinerariifolium]